jgi:hypothetical protein
MREAYVKKWHQEHDAGPAAQRLSETQRFQSESYDDLRPHMWNFFQSVRNRKPAVQDAVFGHHAAAACHMANESYFRKAPVVFDPRSNSIVTART